MSAEVARARTRAEENHPARLLGIAQVAIEVALRTNDVAAIHAQLGDALDRITPTEIPARGTRCVHPKTGVVTSRTHLSQVADVSHAAAPVCNLPDCIAQATAWVERMSRKPAFHLLDAQKAEVPA